MSDVWRQLADIQTEGLKQVIEGIAELLEQGDTEGALQACRFILTLAEMFEGPFELDEAAFMAGALGLPLPGRAADGV